VIAKYQGQQVDPREVGRELNVNAVLAAGFIHAGERFRVTAQLLDVLSGDILWSDRIDIRPPTLSHPGHHRAAYSSRV